MVGYRNQNSAHAEVSPRLETPRASGYRSGMSATGLIGSRLANVYDVTADLPRDMGAVLRRLEGKAGGSR